MPTTRSCLRLFKKIFIFTVAVLLLSNENVVKALLSFLVTLHVAVRIALELVQTAISHHGPGSLIESMTNYYELAMEYIISVTDKIITWFVDLTMLWVRASPKHVCSLNTQLLRVGGLVVAQASDEIKNMVEFDWLEGKELVQRFCELVEA